MRIRAAVLVEPGRPHEVDELELDEPRRDEVLVREHTVLGSNLGAATPALHVPRLATLAAQGRLDLASLVTHRFPLERIAEALELAASGAPGRVVLDLDGSP